VKPTEQTAKPAVTSKIGRFATLRGLLQARGTGASARSLVAAPLVALCGLLALSAGVAHAEAPPLVPYGNFAVAENGIGVAVDNSGLASAGDVYVSSFFRSGEPTLYKFTPAGKPVSPSPFGEPFGFSVSLAVDPKNGDLYSLGASGSVTTYDPSSGAVVGTFPVALTPGPGGILGFAGRPPQIAVDSAGDVYVPNTYGNDVLEYSPEGAPLQTFTGGSGAGALKEPTGVAVDSGGELWVADGGDNRIEKLSPADEPEGEIRSEGVRSIVLYGRGDVLAIVVNGEDFCGKIGGETGECPHLVGYGPTGGKLLDVGAGSFGSGSDTELASIARSLLVAVDEASGHVYVTDLSNERVWVFAPPTAPAVVKELSAEVTTSEAKLGAGVNPGGEPTTYRFEYGTTTAYGNSTPSPEGSVGENFGGHTVWAAAGGLKPGTTYHYRVVASNGLAPEGVYGEDRTFTTLTAKEAECEGNEEFRGGFSARLPDCRAYELVTAPTKNAVESEGGLMAAADGEALWFAESDPLPGAPTGAYHEYLATRGAGGWSSQDLRPLESYSDTTCESHAPEAIFSVELSRSVTDYGFAGRASEPSAGGVGGVPTCNTEGLQVVPGEPVGYKNLLLRENATGTYRLINAPPPGVTPADAFLQGASADLSHVVFSEEAPLAQGAQYGVENLYEWDEGVVRLLTVLPEGTSVQGSLPEVHGGDNVISADGSHIVFISGGGLYVRIDGEHTVQVDKGPGASGGGSFQAASADGSEVFFTDDRRLTAGSTAETGEPDLYECEIVEEEQAGKRVPTCKLSDLTVATGGEHADVIHVSQLGTRDGSHMYFVARGVLASNTREYTDSEGNVVVEKAQAGQNNLYLWSGGTTTFIASGPTTGYEELTGAGQASPDGTWFAFPSAKSLTGYDNIPGQGAPATEIFLYSAASGQLACASCNPTGERPITDGGAELRSLGEKMEPRYLSDGGRLFFETREALVPSDTNDQVDVYEYEDGHVYLISSGSSSQGSTFIDASEGGADIFFESIQALVSQDTQEGMYAIYDARVDGGFPALAPPPACTTADACRAPVPPQPSVYGAPASQTFSGAGNLAPPLPTVVKKVTKKTVECKRGLMKNKKCKCVRKKSKKRAKRASHNRRGK
jgi:DNA-binding beta-propeller fold protein YncE